MLDEKIYGKLSEKELAAIKRYDISDLVTTFDACLIAGQGVLGIINQPRCQEKCERGIETLLTNRFEPRETAFGPKFRQLQRNPAESCRGVT